jgi:hypothetical protein
MDSKVMIGIGVALAAGVGIYLYATKKGTASSDPLAQGASKPAVPGLGSAYAPPAPAPAPADKLTLDKGLSYAQKEALAFQECNKQFAGDALQIAICMASKGL